MTAAEARKGTAAPDPERAATGRILSRETRSSRAPAAVIAALLVIVVAVWALLEVILAGIDQPAWLLDPQSVLHAVARFPEGADRLLLGAAGAVLAMAGLVFLLNAVLPGRRARHVLSDRRAAVVVDDEVIASALARRARYAAQVTQEQVMVVVSQRSAVVNIRPTSGMPVNVEQVRAAVEAELADMAPAPLPAVHINVTTAGVVGA
ncbi:hypothetical protein KIH31_12355 [Paenarthrobacter sp. DKR-5]|uniref:DUF6286 domain-containing protein n=1 Tax=Paenarthrobacter sp. DKR-5 TaxID=2835535 RepID=UPI001BDD5FE5|nr:DUF6286 domain-containing protein [Paenarthrobacter sp. DKR-5]MBT1003395.1 hypothetical protein [Paenarthrobacter sp. DKR-5]